MWAKLFSLGKRAALGAGNKYGSGQSPQIPDALVRVGRFLYQSSLMWIGVCWYTGYVNQRTAPGSGPQLVLPGKKAIAYSPDRGNKNPKFGNAATAGDASNGQKSFAVPKNISDPRRIRLLSLAQSTLGFKSGYQEVRPYPSSLQTLAKTPTDCSGYVTLLYKAAKLTDPNGLSYNGYGYTGTLITRGAPTNNPQPGDLAFWSNPDHVGMVVGPGTVVEWGSAPGPTVNSVSDESKYHSAFIGYRNYLR